MLVHKLTLNQQLLDRLGNNIFLMQLVVKHRTILEFRYNIDLLFFRSCNFKLRGLNNDSCSANSVPAKRK